MQLSNACLAAKRRGLMRLSAVAFRWQMVLVSPCRSTWRPGEVFVKPTTAKGIVKGLEVDLHYQARPTWTFYDGYRKLIVDVRKQVSPTLSPSNAALTGFLMMSL